MIKWKDLVGIRRGPAEVSSVEQVERIILGEEQQESLANDMDILDEEDRVQEEQLHKEATKEVQVAAKASLKRLHVIQMGRCPMCQ